MSQVRRSPGHITRIRREKYRQILKEGHEIEDSVESNDVVESLNAVQTITDKCKALLSECCEKDSVEAVSEILMGAKVVKMTRELFSGALKKINELKFPEENYVAEIRNLIQNNVNEINWSNFDAIILKTGKRFRYCGCISESCDLRPQYENSQIIPQRKRQPRRKAEEAEQLKPLDCTQQSQSGKDSDETKLKSIYIQIRKIYSDTNQPIPYYKLIIDPQNMMNTFDNAFQLSFLFRDSMIGFEYDNENMPAIRPIDKDKSAIPKNVINKQFVGLLDADLIKNMMKKYKIESPLLTVNREIPPLKFNYSM